jgi:hypothetical protein
LSNESVWHHPYEEKYRAAVSEAKRQLTLKRLINDNDDPACVGFDEDDFSNSELSDENDMSTTGLSPFLVTVMPHNFFCNIRTVLNHG